LAQGLFEDLARTDPYGSLGSEAGMRLEELRKKHPELVVVPTNAPTVTPLTIPATPLAKP